NAPILLASSTLVLHLVPSLVHLTIRRHTSSTLFPYTTLFRSAALPGRGGFRHRAGGDGGDLELPAGRAHRAPRGRPVALDERELDRKSTRLNSSHVKTSYAVFCLKKRHSRTHLRADAQSRGAV